MAKTTTTEPTNEQPETRKNVTAEDKRVYATRKDAEDHRPEGKPKWFLFQVTDANGTVKFTWAPYYSQALWQTVIDHDKSYSIIAIEDAPSKADVQGYLAALSPEDRAELLAAYGKKK